MSTRSICHAAAAARRRRRLPAVLGRSVLAMALLCSAAVVQAGDCPLLREPRIPPVPEPVDLVDPINIDQVKTQLRDYHAGNYHYDAAAVLSNARIYIERRLKEPVSAWLPQVAGSFDFAGTSGWFAW